MDNPIKTTQDKKSCLGPSLKGMGRPILSGLDLRKQERVTLLEVLDRALTKGVVISGDIVISVADVDLVYLGLKVLLSSVETMERLRGAPFAGATEEPT